MLHLIAFVALAGAWLAWCFVVLQLVERRSWEALGVVVGALVAGGLVLITRSHEVGLAWIRAASLQSDALALGALPAAIGTGAGMLASRDARSSTWGPASACLAAFGCAIVGVAALALGRSSWYWEFVAVLVAGGLLAVVGASTALRGGTSPNARVVYAGAALFGVFLAIGGGAMLVAWRALA